MSRHAFFRVVLGTAAALVLTASTAFAATPVGQVCQEIAPENLATEAPAADALVLDPTDDALSAAYSCTYFATEWCGDTHGTTPCWTVRFFQPGCPTAQGECVTNIKYHTYDLHWCQ
jgi:hypothetical protein